MSRLQPRRFLRTALPPLAVLAGGLVGFEVVVRTGHVNPYLVPPPSQVLRQVFGGAPGLWSAMLETGAAALVGFGMSAALGIFIALLLSTSRWVERAFYPYAVFFQTVPIIAIAPLLVIWVGYGMPTVVASAFIVSLFPVIANTLDGLLAADPALRDMFRLYGAGRASTMLKLRLPSALPNIMTGLRIAGGLAVIGAIVGEFIGGGGLGAVVDVARTQQRADTVFAAVLLASVLGLAIFGLVNGISRLALRRWHAGSDD